MVDDEAVGTELLGAAGDGGGWRLSSPLLDRIQTPLGIRTSLSRRRRSRTSESFSTFHYLREARTSTLFCYLLFLSDSVFQVPPDPIRACALVLLYGPANEKRPLVYKGQSEPSTFQFQRYFYRTGLPEEGEPRRGEMSTRLRRWRKESEVRLV